MGSLIGSAFGTVCGFVCCGACRQCSEAKTGAVSRLPYIFLFVICALFAIIMSLYGEEELNFKFFSFHVCNDESCYGNGSVFRISFCLFIFELLHVLIIAKGAVAFHYLFFPVKFLCLIAIITASFLIQGTNALFNTYAEIARYLSGVYLVIQILILICYAYDINDYIRGRGDKEFTYNETNDYEQNCFCGCCKGNRWYWWLAIGSVLFYMACFAFLILFYVWFNVGNDCGIHESFISLTIIFISLTATLSIVRGDGSFFVSGIVSFYCVFLLFSTIQADPNTSCNVFEHQRNSSSLWLGCILTLVSLVYAAMRSDRISVLTKDAPVVEDDEDDEKEMKVCNDGNGMEAILLENQSEDKQSSVINIEDEKKDDDNDGDDDDSNYSDVDKAKLNVDEDVDEVAVQRQKDKRSNVYFHLILMLASAYMAMLFTNWGSNSQSIQSVGYISLWVGIVSQWLTFILFWWTIIASKICPHRFPQREAD